MVPGDADSFWQAHLLRHVATEGRAAGGAFARFRGGLRIRCVVKIVQL